MTDSRRTLPAVNTLLDQAERAGLAAGAPRATLVAAIRAVLHDARVATAAVPRDGWMALVGARLADGVRTSLVPVINATGVILHTNLGRAPLAASARAALAASGGYVALEYELNEGRRGSRQDHLRPLICEITGAQDAFVATNAAAALLLSLGALGAGRESIVSRAELVEIGGGFRIPEILRSSGSALVEVGTTNRVRLRDYEAALSPRTGCILKVHQSNFRLTGFTSEVTVQDLVTHMAGRSIPVVHDVGSGLLLDLTRFGLTGEPLVQASVAAGAVVVFSGDKLLGGPQAGIIAGPRAALERIASHPLARALRPDKSTIAALEATLALYRDPDVALSEIPTLRMLTSPPDELARRARRLAKKIGDASVVPGHSSVGGGSFPEAALPTTLVAVRPPSCDEMLGALRQHLPPVVARVEAGAVVFDVRTMEDGEFAAVADSVRAARG